MAKPEIYTKKAYICTVCFILFDTKKQAIQHEEFTNHKIKYDRISQIFKKSILGLSRIKRRMIRHEDRYWLLDMMPKNSVCAEIGVFRGNFSNLILSKVTPKELILIDPWKDYEKLNENMGYDQTQETMKENYEMVKQNLGKFENVKILKMDSKQALSSFPDNYFDWIYIDGDHFYDSVKTDLDISYQKVKPKGYITGDDYPTGKNTRSFSHELKQAVDEFISKNQVELVNLKNRQYVIRKLK